MPPHETRMSSVYAVYVVDSTCAPGSDEGWRDEISCIRSESRTQAITTPLFSSVRELAKPDHLPRADYSRQNPCRVKAAFLLMVSDMRSTVATCVVWR